MRRGVGGNRLECACGKERPIRDECGFVSNDQSHVGAAVLSVVQIWFNSSDTRIPASPDVVETLGVS